MILFSKQEKSQRKKNYSKDFNTNLKAEQGIFII